MLGNGSNILFADEGYDGAVLDISSMQDAVEVHGTQLTAGAGVRLSALCKTALEHGLTGLEFAYGIPGTVGGAVYMYPLSAVCPDSGQTGGHSRKDGRTDGKTAG